MQEVFAQAQFWAALNRLADREGHHDHARSLIGQVNPTNHYELWCVPCAGAVVTMQVERLQPAVRRGARD
jgi:hypothetical protein